MRTLLLFLLALTTLPAQTADEKAAVDAIQKLFDGMAAKNAEAIRAVLLPEVQLYSVRDQNPPAMSTGERFVTQIAGAKGALLERFTGAPHVMVRGRMAVVWGEYEFLRDGKFSHCGVDTATLFQTAEGWKVSSLAYTVETTGCKGR
jgi:hypothetical protein